MKICEDAIKPVGLTLLYEPDWPMDPAVDIVLVHGIGGHPVRTWKCQGQPQTPTTPISTVHGTTIKRRLTQLAPTWPLPRSNSEPFRARSPGSLGKSKSLLRRATANQLTDLAGPARQPPINRPTSLLRKLSVNSPSRPRPRPKPSRVEPPIHAAEPEPEPEPDVDVYWPLELLPTSCPRARVFTWGHHTRVANHQPRRLQGDIFAHAEELLVELAAARTAMGARGGARPIVFIAHSTGGVMVLRLAEAERDGPLNEILTSTSAAVFLGSPHRATGRCRLGDAIRSMAGATLSADPGDAVLQELCGANSARAEHGRQAFVRLWDDCNFRVKTFQESVVPGYQSPALRAETTLRRLASFIGDPREDAETIGALHSDICKFGSAEDAGYQALARVLVLCATAEEDRRHVLNSKETECLAALTQPRPTLPEAPPATPYPGTCLWLYDRQDFQSWHHRDGPNKNKVLWIRGESGCGKTVLLNSLRTRLEAQWSPAGAAFIWSSADAHDTASVLSRRNSRNQQERSLAGVYRSLLAQLFLQDPGLRAALLLLYKRPRSDPRMFDDAQVVSFFADYYAGRKKVEASARRTFVLVEVADDAGSACVHELLGSLSHLAHNSDLSICVASAHHPELIGEENVIGVPVHLRNSDDVLRYVNLNLVAEWAERNRTVMRIGTKSGGVFLWAEIVVNILNAAIIEGATQEMVECTLQEAPDDLHGLYQWLLSTLSEQERAESLILFQWAMLAAEPMRLDDLSVAVRLTDPDPFATYNELGPLMALNIGTPFSMRNPDSPDQFHRWLRARSVGLLELRSDSHRATAKEPLGLQRVQPIHPSVRAFFLSGRGFAVLAKDNPSTPPSLSPAGFLDISHCALLRACLTHLNTRDLEPLDHSTRRPSTRRPSPPLPPSKTHPDLQQTPRHDIMAAHPFVAYAATHLVHHLLAPAPFRHALPQHTLLGVLAAHDLHVRATLFSRAKCHLRQHAKRTAANSAIKAEMLQADGEIAQKLAASGVWGSARKGKLIKTVDRYRVNVVSEQLCDDIISYIKPTLARHEGCDLLDIFPGAGIWSRKLNDVLKPRTHMLLEPDEQFYKPMLEPLLQRPGVKLVPESGIVWEQLNKILSKDYLPHQAERKSTLDNPPERNDTLLVSMNLSMFPKRRFRTFESVAQLVMFQLMSSIRPGALFQKYGLVRMLLWVADDEKVSILPRTAQRRRKLAFEAELGTEWLCEVAGAEEVDNSSPRSNNWFRRDQSIDVESTGNAVRRMREAGITMPPGRESQYFREFLEFSGEAAPAAGTHASQVERPYITELRKLEADFEAGAIEPSSTEHRRLKNLGYWLRWSVKRSNSILAILGERDAAVRAHRDARADPSDAALAARAAELDKAWGATVNALEKSLRGDCILHRDNLHVLHQDPPVLNWDRRYVDPLIVRKNEFFPNVPCALLDIQPKAAAGVLRDMGPHSTRSGDTFDLLLRSLVQCPVDPVSRALEAIYPGAGRGVFPECPSLTDVDLGGSPLTGPGELTTRSLNERQLVEIAEAWMRWPYRPKYAELVARTVDDGLEEGDDQENKVMGNMSANDV
ncbi:S-adenosyl-L-methionine-dependent methyltransferase [Trichocladium antarcticum]|uniref:Mitochondrial transcription factor 1 n=1 Tax=Trichocladium antarcticum TaxID=1450529 RepID=A0AAN6UN74_9PEZI|nr:S-adenosyl-L-methionine-dependent methyltransferase [Trichocladium antarcticum]